jgi:hypothetical protein
MPEDIKKIVKLGDLLLGVNKETKLNFNRKDKKDHTKIEKNHRRLCFETWFLESFEETEKFTFITFSCASSPEKSH